VSTMSGFDAIRPGTALPVRTFKCGNVQQFLYNAVLWNAHRIHFDYPYATEVEGYPGLVVAGPLMGDWLTQCVLEWVGEQGKLLSFEYSNRKAAFTGEVLRSGGKVVSSDPETGTVKLDLHVMNEADEIITPGKAVVRFPVG
jgi:hydroxyacyl-ACP dehydratase HTD2-like protein with hotdog domain